jgi:hypothetical protein
MMMMMMNTSEKCAVRNTLYYSFVNVISNSLSTNRSSYLIPLMYTKYLILLFIKPKDV